VLGLSEKIIEAHERNGLVTFFIYGAFADGKTSYILHAMYEVLGYLGKLRDVDAWFAALDHIFFNPLEGLLYVQVHRQKTGKRVPVLGMDDVGQHIPRARWNTTKPTRRNNRLMLLTHQSGEEQEDKRREHSKSL